MPDAITVGEVIARYLEQCGVDTIYGVISIHNMPILDAIGRRDKIRFVPSRGEAGACNMADAHARVSASLGVCVTSTGTGAGNAAGAMIEAQTAGTPLLHLTGQIETAYLDQDRAYIHEARDQLGMLKAVSKGAFRIRSADTALGIMQQAISLALSAPAGPVSVEIPIDVQQSLIQWPDCVSVTQAHVLTPDSDSLDRLARALSTAKRPMLWLGGGARHASDAATQLADMGFGVVTSTQGRGVVAEQHPHTVGAFTVSPAVEALYASSDALLVVGSRLRGNETLKYTLELPETRYRIDVDASANNRSYSNEQFVQADANLALAGLVQRLAGKLQIDPAFAGDIQSARRAARATLTDSLGPYSQLVDSLSAMLPEDFVWVRDVTISNSTWGNRCLTLQGPFNGVHALGGGIGQALPMSIGASMAAKGRKVVCLVGDGGLQLNLGELKSAVQEDCNILFVVMNSRGYAVIKNIQDAHYGSRHYFVDVDGPDLSALSAAMGLAYAYVDSLDVLDEKLRHCHAVTGPALVEVDMSQVGDFKQAFAGPPVRS